MRPFLRLVDEQKSCACGYIYSLQSPKGWHNPARSCLRNSYYYEVHEEHEEKIGYQLLSFYLVSYNIQLHAY